VTMLDRALAKRIRLVGLDVDGVMTDGGIYVGLVADHAVEFKRFHIQDGLGVKMLQWAGIPVALVSGRRSDATTLRAKELGIEDVVQDDGAKKLPAFEEILARRGVRWEACAFVGDDLADLPLLRRVGLPVAVANAVAEVKAAAALVTATLGGQGAVREVAEAILKARGDWPRLVTEYLEQRGDVAERALGSR